MNNKNWIIPDWTIAACMAILTLFTTALHAASFTEGQDYEVLEKPGKTDDPSKIEVREFFWFGCGHCFALEGELKGWLKDLPADTAFVATPAPMNASWTPHAHAFYVADALDKLDTIKPDLFNALHVKKEKVYDREALAKFFTNYDVTEDQFNKLYDSFSVRVKVRKAEDMVKSYRLRGVPALIVNGKYLVKAPKGKSFDYMLDIVDYLIEKERNAIKASGVADASGIAQ